MDSHENPLFFITKIFKKQTKGTKIMTQTVKLTDYLSGNGIIRIKTNVKAENQDQLVEELAGLFFPSDSSKKYELKDHLIKNEGIRPTAEKGCAIPHTRNFLVEKTQAAIITTKGTEYPSTDGQPVYVAICIVNAKDDLKLYLPLLGACATMIKENRFTPLIEKIKRGYSVEIREISDIINQYS